MIDIVQAFDRALIAQLESDDATALEIKSNPPRGSSRTETLG
jgi:hypothetical protein